MLNGEATIITNFIVSNPRSNTLEASILIIKPSMLFIVKEKTNATQMLSAIFFSETSFK